MTKKFRTIGLAGILLLILASLIVVPLLDRMAKMKKLRAKLKMKQEELQRRGSAAPFEGVSVDLKPYFTAELTESVSSRVNVKENHLAEVPTGKQIFGGVPFQVEGVVQLMGRALLQFGKEYPEKVEGIIIKKQCKRVHIFHGSTWAQGSEVIAKLILSYADGTKKELPIQTGEHVLDFWGTSEDVSTDPDTSMAWTGSNPWIKKWKPEMVLRLFKTSFNNPQPSVELTSIDYVSTMTLAAPFMISLTLE